MLDLFPDCYYIALVSERKTDETINHIEPHDMELNKITITRSTYSTYVILDRETGDFQQVDPNIGHSLKADLESVKLRKNKDTADSLQDACDKAKEAINHALGFTNVTVLFAGFSL